MVNDNRTSNFMASIHEGMDVYDSNDKKVGSVETVYFGDEDLSRPGTETVTANQGGIERNNLIDAIVDALAAEDRMPETLRARLVRYGFVQVDAGMLKSDRLVLPDQILEIRDKNVYLSVVDDDLITS